MLNRVLIDIFLVSLILLLEEVSPLTQEKKSYQDYKVLRVYPESSADLDLLHSIGDPNTSLTDLTLLLFRGERV